MSRQLPSYDIAVVLSIQNLEDPDDFFQPWSSSSPDDILVLWRLGVESEPLTALQPHSRTQQEPGPASP